MQLSLVTTLFCSEGHLAEFYSRICQAAAAITENFELILVNDGSPDASLQKAIFLSEQDERVVVIDLSRNFGHHKAIMTGLARAKGEYVFLIDSDLEEPPEVLPEFYSELQRQQCDVVYGYQAQRQRGLLDKLIGESFYRLFNRISDLKIPFNPMTVRLMTRRYVKALVQHREQVVFIDGLWASTGYQQFGLQVAKKFKGSTSYGLWKRVSLAITSLSSFSEKPILMVTILGCGISLIALGVCVYLGYLYLTRSLLLGWLSLIASIWLLGGLTIFCIGIVGLYTAKIFVEVKQRPYTIVRDVYCGGHAIKNKESTY